MRITSVQDLNNLGLRHLAGLHPQIAEVAGRVQLGILDKYASEGEALTRRWAAVDGFEGRLSPSEPFERYGTQAMGVEGVMGSHRPHVLISNEGMEGDASTFVRGVQADADNGFLVPTVDPIAQLFIHEGVHPIVQLGLALPPVQIELEIRISQVLDQAWHHRDRSPASDLLMAAWLSRYAGANQREAMTEAMTEWNEPGNDASPLAVVIGTTFDRYFANPDGVNGFDSPLVAYLEEVADYRRSNVEMGRPFGYPSNPLRSWKKVPAWAQTFAEFLDAHKNNKPLPSIQYRPLNLSGWIDLDVPDSQVRAAEAGKKGWMDQRRLRRGQMDGELAKMHHHQSQNRTMLYEVERFIAPQPGRQSPKTFLPLYAANCSRVEEQRASRAQRIERVQAAQGWLEHVAPMKMDDVADALFRSNDPLEEAMFLSARPTQQSIARPPEVLKDIGLGL